MPKPSTQEFDLDAFSIRLDAETDRGCGVLGAALLEVKLGFLFRRRFRAFHKDLLGNTRPLGSFGARILTARALAWISEDARVDLDSIRSIRNDFAHSDDLPASQKMKCPEKAARGGRAIIQPDYEHARPRPARSGLPDIVVSDDDFAPNGQPQRRYLWGPDPDANLANYENTGIGSTSAVGVFRDGASPYGCEEMSGNCWEWTRSLWAPYPYPERPEERLKREALDGPRDKPRALRGGGFFNSAKRVRCASRLRDVPVAYGRGFGFRVVVRPLL